MTGRQAPAGPLAGVRVVEFTHFLAGPYAGLVLADLGADVVKLEDPGRPDEARGMGPHFQHGQSLYFASLNWSKRSLGVRLSAPGAAAVLDPLLAGADVVLTNYRPSALAKVGLDTDRLTRDHPHLVTCTLTGFGETGPDADRPGYDYTIQAATGVMGLAGAPGGQPVKAGISYVDHSGGLAAALGICAALVERARTGRGRHVDLGLLDVQVSMLTYLAAWSLNAGFEPAPVADSAHPSIVPAQNFPTADGWLTVFVGNDSMWARLVEVLGDDRLAGPDLARSAGRLARRDHVVGVLKEILSADTAAVWAARLSAAGVAASPVNTVGEALADAQVAARGLVSSSSHPGYGAYRHVAGPLPGMWTAAGRGAPLLGEHTAEILAELGVDPAAVADVVAAGAAPAA